MASPISWAGLPFQRGVMVRCSIFALAICVIAGSAGAGDLSRLDRERGHVMLRHIRKDLTEHYYDPGLRGIDAESRYRIADECVERAATLGAMFRAIAEFLNDLGDAHTAFVPPPRTIKAEYGWDMEMIGDRCMVISGEPGSDAEKQGLRRGPRIRPGGEYRRT